MTKDKAKNKKATPQRIQGYFTRGNLAMRIAEFIHEHTQGSPIETVMDPSGGVGYLLNGFLEAKVYRDMRPLLHMIEPVPPMNSELPYGRIKSKVGLYDMTLEEWCLTYAEPESYDLWLCNPPFNQRIGTTKMGEYCHKLFRPEISLFETLFFLVGSVVAKRHMAFIVPDTYFKKEEARTTMQRLAMSGWELLDLRALPLDGCYDALENMSFLFFGKQSPVSNWVDQALDLITRHAATPLFRNRQQKTLHAAHGPRTGYLLEEGSTKQDAQKGLDLETYFMPEGQFTPPKGLSGFDWTPTPREEGDLWNRMGCVYELTSLGWVPANSQGYCDGVPVSDAFDKARKAYAYLQKSAFYTANHLIQGLNLNHLRSQYQNITSASFLNLLSPGKIVENPFEVDLAHLGMIELSKDEEPDAIQSSDIERVHDYLVSRKHLTNAQACELFLKYETIPSWILEKVKVAIGHQSIPMDKIALRSPWLPRPLVAEFLNIGLDAEGFYLGSRLARYLNYGKNGESIQEGDKDLYEIASQKFAISMNNWDSFEHTELRLKVHAHYFKACAPTQRVIEAYAPPKTAPGVMLHPWQSDDLNFYLSGATLSNLGVGVGKTLTALAAAVAYSQNTKRKVLIAVPKQVLMKWKRELETFFPNVGVHLLGFYPKKKGDGVARRPQKGITEEARKVFWNHDIQVIITSHQVIGDFKLRPEEMLAADRQNASDQKGTGENKTAVKAREAFIVRSAERNLHFGGELTWSDLPAGMCVIIDEAHNYKNLFPMPGAGWGQTLIMAGSASESKRARDLQIKLDIVRQRGGKTIGLTANLVSNSVAEIYNMLRIFAPQVLEQMGLHNSQEVIDYFCTIEPIISVSIVGTIKNGTTITGFKNLDVLSDLWDKCTKTYTAEDVGLQVPEVVEIKEMIQPTPEVQNYMDYWKDLLEAIIQKKASTVENHSEDADGDKETKKVCIFDVIAALDKVAAHPPQVDIDECPKLDRMAGNVLKVYHSPRHTGQQLIFADVKSVQLAIKHRLVLEGIPENEIVIVNADTAPDVSDRLKIQDKFNRGTYRICIGGKCISEGIDLQRNTHCAHFINLAWEGATLEQRFGRLVRQGNINAKVGIYYYILEESTDIYRFMTIQRKTQWVNHLRSSQTETINDKSIFCDEVDDELLLSLATNKDTMRETLTNYRREQSIHQQIAGFEKTLRLMCEFARPDQRKVSLEILQAHEEKLRDLEFISQELVDSAIQRVQELAYLQFKRSKNPETLKSWPAWVKDVRHFQISSQKSSTFTRFFEAHFSVNGVCLKAALEELVKPELLEDLPTFDKTFGKRSATQRPVEETNLKKDHDAFQVITLDRCADPILDQDQSPKPEIISENLAPSKEPRNDQLLYQNCHRFCRLIPDIDQISKSAILAARGQRCLYLEILNRTDQVISFSMYQTILDAGDLIPDPDMELKLDLGLKTIEAMTLQDRDRYEEVYGRDNGIPNYELKDELNEFLSQWLTELLNQGYRIQLPEANEANEQKNSAKLKIKKSLFKKPGKNGGEIIPFPKDGAKKQVGEFDQTFGGSIQMGLF